MNDAIHKNENELNVIPNLTLMAFISTLDWVHFYISRTFLFRTRKIALTSIFMFGRSNSLISKQWNMLHSLSLFSQSHDSSEALKETKRLERLGKAFEEQQQRQGKSVDNKSSTMLSSPENHNIIRHYCSLTFRAIYCTCAFLVPSAFLLLH